MNQPSGPAPLSPPLRLERRHWLAALAVLVVFFAPYQTLVQTVLTDDAVRKGLDIDDYDMTWQQVGYGVGILYGVFVGLWLSARIGARCTIALGLVGIASPTTTSNAARAGRTFSKRPAGSWAASPRSRASRPGSSGACASLA